MSDIGDIPTHLDPMSVLLLGKFTRDMNSFNTKQLDKLAAGLKWGTYGPSGEDRIKVKCLNDLDTDHLENIMVTQPQITALYKKVILYIIKLRISVEAAGVPWA